MNPSDNALREALEELVAWFDTVEAEPYALAKARAALAAPVSVADVIEGEVERVAEAMFRDESLRHYGIKLIDDPDGWKNCPEYHRKLWLNRAAAAIAALRSQVVGG